MLKKILILVLVLAAFSCTKDTDILKVDSPNAKNTITFQLENGIPYYSVSHGETDVLRASQLGFVFKDHDSLSGDFELLEAEQAPFDETWEQVWGEKQWIRNNYNELSVTLQETTAAKRMLNVQFRAFDDGIALRYNYPKQGEDSLVIMDELTEFKLAADGDAWWIPAYSDNRYEYLTTRSLVSELDTVHTPLTIKSNNGLSLSFHEANLKDYASMTLARTEGTSLKADLVPWADGDRVKTNGSFTTPWRTLQIA